jgi:N-formylglutamate deformylase
MPPAFLAAAALSPRALREFEDAHVGALLAGAVAAGLPLVEATHSRAFIDLNRHEAELDRTMFDGPIGLPVRLTDRVRAGYGVIPRRIAPDRPIYRGLLPAAEARRRIEGLHQPWHAMLRQRLLAIRATYGAAVLLDCHSMPSLPATGGETAQIVIGDLFGQSAAAPLVDLLHRLFCAAGFAVARNQPYAGGHTTRHHCAPAAGVHVIQLEIDRALYLDPVSLAPGPGFAPLAARLAGLLDRFAHDAWAMLPLLRRSGEAPLPLAAE